MVKDSVGDYLYRVRYLHTYPIRAGTNGFNPQAYQGGRRGEKHTTLRYTPWAGSKYRTQPSELFGFGRRHRGPGTLTPCFSAAVILILMLIRMFFLVVTVIIVIITAQIRLDEHHPGAPHMGSRKPLHGTQEPSGPGRHSPSRHRQSGTQPSLRLSCMPFGPS